MNCENTSTRRPSASSSGSISMQQRRAWRASLTLRAASQLDQARVAADLAQLEQRVEDRRSGCGRSPRAGDLVAHLARASRRARSRRGRAARPRSSTLRTISVLAGSSLRHLLLGAAQEERPDAACEQVAARGCRRASRSACGTGGGTCRRRRGSPASGSRTATTARRGGSPAACRSGTGGGARRAAHDFARAWLAGVLDRLRLVEDQQVELCSRQQRPRRAAAAGRW